MAEYKSIYTGEEIDAGIGKANTALQQETDPIFSASASANITNQDIENWNGKSNFSGDYEDLSNKPEIPSATSDLTNDSGFIDNTVNNLTNYTRTSDLPTNLSDFTNDTGFIIKTVNDLTNYYLKNEVYTKDEVTSLIGAIQQFHYEVVQELPQTGANNIMYLVPKSTSQTNNVYDEYVYSNGWEKIGDTEIDLSNYVTITALNQALANYTTTANLTTLLAGKQDVLTAGDNIDITNNVISAEIPSDLKVFYIEDNSSQNPFVFEEHETGVYFFKAPNPTLQQYSRHIYLKAFKKTNAPISTSIPIGLALVYYNKVNQEISSQEIAYVSFYIDDNWDLKYMTIKTDTSGNLKTSWQFYKTSVSNLVKTKENQEITGVKTFNTLPESGVVPTTNRQLVNKKYVDDNIPSPTQYATMPTASADTVGKIVQYTGTTDSTYTNGYFYIGTTDEQDPATYSWENMQVQKYEEQGMLVLNQFDPESTKLAVLQKVYELTKNNIIQPILYVGLLNNSANQTFLIPVSSASLKGYINAVESAIGGYGVSYHIQRSITIDLTIQNNQVTSYNINNTIANYYINALNGNNQILGTNNTTAYTPTGNYNPATKKYVDDTVSTAVGNINTVLASLTTPSGNGGE